MSTKVIYAKRTGDYLNLYRESAIKAAECLNLTLQSVGPRHSTALHPTGTPHVGIPVSCAERWLYELGRAGFTVIAEGY